MTPDVGAGLSQSLELDVIDGRADADDITTAAGAVVLVPVLVVARRLPRVVLAAPASAMAWNMCGGEWDGRKA